MFRSFVIAVIVTMAAVLESVADAIAATLPPPAADGPRLRVVASGRLCRRRPEAGAPMTASYWSPKNLRTRADLRARTRKNGSENTI